MSERSCIPDAGLRTIDGGLGDVLGEEEGEELVENGRAGMMLAQEEKCNEDGLAVIDGSVERIVLCGQSR